MLIKYKVKIQKNGLTITQEIDSTSSAAQVKPGAAASQNALQGNVNDSAASAQNKTGKNSQEGGGGDAGDHGGGGDAGDIGGTGLTATGSPITIFGPFLFLCPDEDNSNQSSEVDEDE